MTDLKPFIAKAAAGQALNRSEADQAFDVIMSGSATPSQIGGFLMALRVRGETVDEIAGAVGAMRARMLTVDAPADAIDIVGTGGDGAGTYNISTLTALIVAGAGVPVAKHGNRALSSKSGTADALSCLGVKLDIGPPRSAAASARPASASCLPSSIIPPCAMWARPAWSSARAPSSTCSAAVNPAGVKRQLLGVFAPQWVVPLAEVLRDLGSETAWVVHGDGSTKSPPPARPRSRHSKAARSAPSS